MDNPLKQLDSTSQKQLDRRQLLKAMLGTGVVLSSLPNEWTQPVVETALLPVHAQASDLPPLTCIDPGRQIDVVLAVDRSGSIGSADLENLKMALTLFVDGRDLLVEQIGLVSFDTTAILEQELTQNIDDIKAAINKLRVGGLTDIAGAIRLCDVELMSHNRPPNKKVIILISDGGQTVSGDPIAEANNAKNKDIHILTVGAGGFFDVAILRAMATSVKDFYYTPQSIDLITVFDPNCKL